jgi:hypothetical protein
VVMVVAVAVAVAVGVGPEAAGTAEGAMLCGCFTGDIDGLSEDGHGESIKSGGAGAVRGSCDRKPTVATTTAISTIIAIITCRSGCTSQGQLGQHFVRREVST